MKAAGANTQALLARVRRFKGKTVGVLGDYMLDELLRGESTRISPEAPVPVVWSPRHDQAEGFPGGAGNVAGNVAALGGRAIPFGAIGRDAPARRLVRLLAARRIPCRTLLAEAGRVTPRKVRIVAHQHQLLRLDFENPAPICPRIEKLLVSCLRTWISRLDALVISDYRKGSVTPGVCTALMEMARARAVPVFVDPKPEHWEVCRGATLATPNLHEAERMTGLEMRTTRELARGGRVLLEKLMCQALLITRGAEGMTLFEGGGRMHQIHSVPRPVYDVTGAGDTVIAVLALAVSAGASLRQAAELANVAGGRVVLKFGTSEITAAELMAAVREL